jgi:hypothetical protein
VLLASPLLIFRRDVTQSLTATDLKEQPLEWTY